MSVIDIVVIAIVALLAIIGLWKGFFDGLISICSIFVSLIISVATANWFAGLIRGLVDIDGWFDSLLTNTFNVGESLVIFGASYPREKVATFLTVLFAGIIMFIFIRCLVALLKNLFKSLTSKSKTLGGLNRFFGFILGALKGTVLVSVVLAVCSVVTSLGIPGLSDTINSAISNTKVTAFAYEYVDEFVSQKMNGKSFEEIIDGLFDEDKAKEQDLNTSLEVIYENNQQPHKFVLNEEVDYSKIIVVYKAGAGAETIRVNLTSSNFSTPINTSELTENATTTITAYGKTVEFIYSVVNA